MVRGIGCAFDHGSSPRLVSHFNYHLRTPRVSNIYTLWGSTIEGKQIRYNF